MGFKFTIQLPAVTHLPLPQKTRLGKTNDATTATGTIGTQHSSHHAISGPVDCHKRTAKTGIAPSPRLVAKSQWNPPLPSHSKRAPPDYGTACSSTPSRRRPTHKTRGLGTLKFFTQMDDSDRVQCRERKGLILKRHLNFCGPWVLSWPLTGSR
jgi:hypothetical protein